MPENPILLGYKWFPTAHLDFYVARPCNIPLLTLSSLYDAHEYYWITEKKGGLQEGMDAYLFNSSRYYFNMERWSAQFESMTPLDTVFIYRNNKKSMFYEIWYLKGYKSVSFE